MAKRKKQSENSPDQTLVAFVAGCTGGVAVAYIAEITYEAIRDEGAQMPGLPAWRVHMACACVGMVALTLSFYLLEVVGRQSKRVAWRSSSLWTPLIAVTGVATVIHIPAYAVMIVSIAYSVWAFRKMRTIR
jgi:hypothetical protein